MIITRARQAMGPRDGDTLTIENGWESVTIVRCVADFTCADEGRTWYELDGMSERGRFDGLGPALLAAFEYLAEYERGRCD